MTLSRREWQRLLGAIDLTTHAEVVDALAGAQELPRDRAARHVDEAIENGPLVEDPDAEVYGSIRLEADERAENTPEEGGSLPASPGLCPQ